MTTTDSNEQAERLAALKARRSPAAPTRTRHPAQGARIAATGLSATALFAIVAGLALSTPPEPSTATDQLAAIEAPATGPVDTLPALLPPPVPPVGSNPAPATNTPVNGSPDTTTPTVDPTGTPAPAAGPVQLQAVPRVQVVPAPAAAPVARTHGSR